MAIILYVFCCVNIKEWLSDVAFLNQHSDLKRYLQIAGNAIGFAVGGDLRLQSPGCRCCC
jgi:hypothetical protein